MLSSKHIEWLQRISGYSADDIVRAIDRVESWGIPALSSHLGSESGADGHLAATMLCQAIDWLIEAGVDETRLLAKLRRPDVWSMWTEIRVAGLIVHLAGDVQQVELDVPVGATSGHNTDFRFRFADDRNLHRIEIKALGLSAKERRFCQDWAPVLRAIEPAKGICVLHADIDTPPPSLNRKKRRKMSRDVARRCTHWPPLCGPVSATVVAAHGTRQQYVRRLAAAITEHLSQLPDQDVGWMAFHWGNGAPLDLIREAILEADLPQHIAGVILAGSAIILDGRMHHMLVIALRASEAGELVVDSKIEGFDPRPIIDGFEVSVGVRPTILRVPGGEGPREILARDGSEPLWPFNILASPDPGDAQAMVYD